MDRAIAENPLAHLDYFIEWGGTAWERMLERALHEYIGTDLTGQKVLEIGTRWGKVACLFALLGAEATGVDIREEHLNHAREEAKKWGLAHKVNFITYEGDLDIFPDESFDLIFTKSVLGIVPELPRFLKQVSAKLTAAGKVVFLENSRGNALLHALRRLRHRHWDSTRWRYFTNRELALVRDVFDVKDVKKTSLPPIMLMCGHRKTRGSDADW